MPQIPTYTAQGKAVEQDYPRDVPVENFEGLAVTGQAVQKIGQQTGQVADYYRGVEEKINALKVKNNTVGVAANYDAGLSEIEEGIQQDGLINSREAAEAKFREREKKLRADSFTNAETPAAKFALDTHIKEKFPKHLNNARHIGNTKAADWNVGQLAINRERLMGLAAQEVDPAESRKYEQEYQNLLLEAQNKSHIKPEKYETDLRTFKGGVYDKKADILLNGDKGPEMFRAAVRNEVFGKINAEGQWEGMDLAELTKKGMKANEIDSANENKERQAHARQTTLVKANWDRRIHSKDQKITEQEFQAARDGNNPYILPHEADEYEKKQLNPPNPQNDLAVKTLQQEYRRGSITQERVDAYRARAEKLGIDSKNDALSQFYNELQSDESTARALNNQQITKAKANVRGAVEDDIKKIPPPIGGRFIKSMIANMNTIDKAAVEKAMRQAEQNGGGPKEIETAGKEAIAKILKDRTNKAISKPDAVNRQRLYE